PNKAESPSPAQPLVHRSVVKSSMIIAASEIMAAPQIQAHKNPAMRERPRGSGGSASLPLRDSPAAVPAPPGHGRALDTVLECVSSLSSLHASSVSDS